MTQLKVAQPFSANGGNVAYLHNAEGETEAELIAMPEGQTFEGKGMFLCFATDDLKATHRIATDSETNPEPTAKYFYVYDPDGVSVQLREYKRFLKMASSEVIFCICVKLEERKNRTDSVFDKSYT